LLDFAVVCADLRPLPASELGLSATMFHSF
jgi:hypothetical protein